ncbi:MAG TPA: hypothetical protein VNK95_18985 [Caldilineaceae bacterium]|nr:hypothetical protein [Caldilineaceae bacterium]
MVTWGALFIWSGEANAGQHLSEAAQETPAGTSSSPTVLVDASAVVTDGVIVYTIDAANVTGQSVWDLNITLPIPEGATFLSAEVTAPLVAEYYDSSITFYAAELKGKAVTGPQRVRVALADHAPMSDGTALVSTQVEASWKSIGAVLHQSTWFLASAATSAIILPADISQQLVADMPGDVPLPSFDLTGAAVRQEGSLIRVDLYVAGPLGPVGEPNRYTVFFDVDCNRATGRAQGELGVDYQVFYRHDRGRAEISSWSVAEDADGKWLAGGSMGVSNPADSQVITLWIPWAALEHRERFCWSAQSEHLAGPDAPKLPKDRVPNNDNLEATFTQFARWDDVAEISLRRLISDTTAPITAGSPDREPAGLLLSPAPPSVQELSGKLAVSLVNDQGLYDVHIYSLPDGGRLAEIPNAHQPEFRFDGANLLFTQGEMGAATVYQYDLASESATPLVNVEPSSHPSYNPLGTLIVYEEPRMAVGSSVAVSMTDLSQAPAIVLGCGLPADMQAMLNDCGGFSEPSALIPLEPFGAIRGTHPLWTDTNKIIYRGCHTWGGADVCGIYMLPAASFTGSSQRFFPERLTRQARGVPGDTVGNLAVMMLEQEGDWEVYASSLDGRWVINLSRDPDAMDGLPAISPDGTWAAFVSNRGGEWAVWAAPINGVSVQKLFALPASAGWDANGQEWLHERMSWGP